MQAILALQERDHAVQTGQAREEGRRGGEEEGRVTEVERWQRDFDLSRRKP